MSTPIEKQAAYMVDNPKRPGAGKVVYDNRTIAETRTFPSGIVEVRLARTLFGTRNDVAKHLTAEEVPSWCQTMYDKLKQGDL